MTEGTKRNMEQELASYRCGRDSAPARVLRPLRCLHPTNALTHTYKVRLTCACLLPAAARVARSEAQRSFKLIAQMEKEVEKYSAEANDANTKYLQVSVRACVCCNGALCV